MRTYCYWCGKEITDKVYDCIWTYMNGQHRPFHLKCYGDKKQGVKQPTR